MGEAAPKPKLVWPLKRFGEDLVVDLNDISFVEYVMEKASIIIRFKSGGTVTRANCSPSYLALKDYFFDLRC